jgi:predicted alpha/beta hydrolase family esterase
MAKQVLFLQGGGEGGYDADQALADSLQQHLGDNYAVEYPKMEGERGADYAFWADTIGRFIDASGDGVILAGHSFGASLILKYLSENKVDTRIAGVFLVAPPFWGAEDWEVDDYVLQSGWADKLPSGVPIFLYHAKDDEVAPLSHVESYAAHLPQATVRVLESGGHQINENLSAVAADIKAL